VGLAKVAALDARPLRPGARDRAGTWLASDQPLFVHGTALQIDGGYINS
jgi:hypothetical protein